MPPLRHPIVMTESISKVIVYLKFDKIQITFGAGDIGTYTVKQVVNATTIVLAITISKITITTTITTSATITTTTYKLLQQQQYKPRK